MQSSFESQLKFARKNIASEPAYQHLTPQQQEDILNRRIQKFYSDNEQIKVDQEHFQPRIEPVYLPQTTPAPNVLLLFGTDFITKQQRKQLVYAFQGRQEIINRSNSLLHFPSADLTKSFIRNWANQNSKTYFKVEQDDQDEQLMQIQNSFNMSQIPVEQKQLPREWIQLIPYTYTHSFTPKHSINSQHQKYSRVLFVRYATTTELQNTNSDVLPKIDKIIQKCRQIWQTQAKNKFHLREHYKEKLQRLEESRNYIQQQRTQSNIPAQEARGRSRSREKRTQDLDVSILGKNSKQPHKGISLKARQTQKEGTFHILADVELQSQFSVRQMDLINQFDQLNMSADKSPQMLNQAIQRLSICNKRQRKAQHIPYKVMQTPRERYQVQSSGFNYNEYMKKLMNDRDKYLKVAQINIDSD